MSYQTTYPGSPDYVIDADYSEAPKESFGSKLMAWLDTPIIGSSPESAMREIQTDRCHAFIAATALQHVAELSVLEGKAIEAAPQGAHRYAALVDSYTEGAVRMVRRWR